MSLSLALGTAVGLSSAPTLVAGEPATLDSSGGLDLSITGCASRIEPPINCDRLSVVVAVAVTSVSTATLTTSPELSNEC